MSNTIIFYGTAFFVDLLSNIKIDSDFIYMHRKINLRDQQICFLEMHILVGCVQLKFPALIMLVVLERITSIIIGKKLNTKPKT